MVTSRLEAWNAVDWAVATYATYVAAVAIVFRETVAHWPFLLVGHAALVVALLLMPPRGAQWEQVRRTTLSGGPGCGARRGSSDTPIPRCS